MTFHSPQAGGHFLRLWKDRHKCAIEARSGRLTHSPGFLLVRSKGSVENTGNGGSCIGQLLNLGSTLQMQTQWKQTMLAEGPVCKTTSVNHTSNAYVKEIGTITDVELLQKYFFPSQKKLCVSIFRTGYRYGTVQTTKNTSHLMI